MAKANNKTVETELSVNDFLEAIDDETKRNDCLYLANLMEKVTNLPAKMWGPAIVGFGSYHYKYESGREGDAPLVAFSPRKNEISLYLSSGFNKREELLAQFGKHKSAKACIYVKKLNDVNEEILKEMVKLSMEHVKSLYA